MPALRILGTRGVPASHGGVEAIAERLLLVRIRRIRNLINMDGIGWRRAKWGKIAKSRFWLKDWLGCWFGNHLITDNPHIQDHLTNRVSAQKITTIPYGADAIHSAPTDLIDAMRLAPGDYITVNARPEPDSPLLEIVQCYASRPRHMPLFVLGHYEHDKAYYCAVIAAASADIRFIRGIYNKPLLQALRFHSSAYIHGHQVGGTNPSLVEAMAAGNSVIAHHNCFNRRMAGDCAIYFSNVDALERYLARIVEKPHCLQALSQHVRERFAKPLTWDHISRQYQSLLLKCSHWKPALFLRGSACGVTR